jgi:hypothetical protein
LAFGEAEVMNQVFQDLFAMLARFEHHPVDAVFIELEDSRCPPDAVRFRNSQNNPLDGFPAIVGMQKDGITILRKPLVTGFATQ